MRLRSLEPGSLKSYFRWVSASIKMTSQQVGKPWSGQLPAWSEEEPREAAEADDLSTRFSLPEDRDAPPTRCGPFPRRSSASTPAAP